MPRFEDMETGYRNLWARMQVVRTEEALQAAQGILEDRARYENVEEATGVPWFFMGPVHHRESARSFAGVLHNGERIIGTGRRTLLVPKGRGPFASWDEAAIDALQLQKLHQVDDWTLPRILYEFERYNGFGYVKQRMNSPYVWAGTNLQQPGKYVRDGVFDRGHMDRQLGCAAMLAKLMELDDGIAVRLGIKGEGESASSDDEPGPFTSITDYDTDVLITELTSRPHIASVKVRYRKPPGP